MMKQVQAMNLIRGRWHESASGKRFESLNPADTREVIGTAPWSGASDVDAAVRAAREAYPMWKAMSRVKRGELIDNLAQLIKRDLNALSELVTRECGKPINEGRADVVEALHMTQYVAGMARMPHGEIIDSEIAEKDAYILRKPKGVVACITPWNFPVAIPLWTILPSLLEGQHSRVQALGGYTHLRTRVGGTVRGGRFPAWRVQSGAWPWRGCRRSAGASPRSGCRGVHGFLRCRALHHPGVRQVA
jgi:delta 1-pyrroline-5-carboxylate dehydrogenase